MTSRKKRIAILVVSVSTLVVIAFLLFRSYLKSHEVYQRAVHLVETNQQVIALLGQPIEASYFFSASIRNMRNARYGISFTGPKGQGSLLAWAYKEKGRWRFTQAIFTTPHKEIDLLAARPTAH